MKTYIPFVFLFLFYILPLSLRAQQSAKITGIVQDAQQTLPSATILLYAVKDSVLVTTAMTDVNGKFSITAAPGNYYILSTSVGYDKVKTASFQLNGTAVYQVPSIILKENSKKA